MARMPYHVQIHPYRREADGSLRYALLERSDYANVWQGFCGGGEEGESIWQTALRETREEGGVTQPITLYHLNSTSWMEATLFEKKHGGWGGGLVVMPMYYFGMPYEGEITLSDEHVQCLWLTYEAVLEKLYFSEHKTALYELDTRIKRGNIEREPPAWMQAEHNIESYINYLGS